MIRNKLLIAVVLLSLPSLASSADLPFYIGVSAGASSLRPDTENSAFEIDSSVSAGAGVFIGYDFSPRISFEAGYNELGSATLSNDTGKSDISYSAISAGALMYLYGDADDIAERNGFSGYVRLGLNSMSNETNIPLEQADNVAIWAGVGIEWPFARSLSLRGELSSFDGDAQAARLSVLFRPRTQSASSRASRVPGQPSLPDQSTPSGSVQQRPSIASSPAPNPVPSPVPGPLPKIVQPSQTPSNDVASGACQAPAVNEPTDAQGCALFSGPLRGVEFSSGTAQLTPVGLQLLDRLAQKLLSYPRVVVEVQAHTESFGNAARAKEIAKQRTLAVARYLAGKGVPVSRLRARAFGHSKPLSADDTVAGRRRNNRVELQVLR